MKMRKCILMLASIGMIVLGGLATVAPAGASVTKTTIPHGGVSLKGLHLVPIPNSGGAFALCDDPSGTNPTLCANDSGFGCTDSTPVLGWQDVDTANEAVYLINQSNGYSNIHFQSCGNSWCIWQYGFGGSGNYLYMHTCSATANNDDFYEQSAGGIWDYVRNKGDNQFLGAGTNQGQQLYTSVNNGGYSNWAAFGV